MSGAMWYELCVPITCIWFNRSPAVNASDFFSGLTALAASVCTTVCGGVSRSQPVPMNPDATSVNTEHVRKFEYGDEFGSGRIIQGIMAQSTQSCKRPGKVPGRLSH
jgi:hypothetical protein